MESNNELISKAKEEIKKLKLEILEKMDKLDELLESIDNSNDEEF